MQLCTRKYCVSYRERIFYLTSLTSSKGERLFESERASAKGREEESRRFLCLNPALQLQLICAMTMTVCNVSSIIEYSTLCLGEDPPEDCYPSVKSQEPKTIENKLA